MAVAFVNDNSSITNLASSTTLTGNQNINASGTNLCALVHVVWNDEFGGFDVSSVTWDNGGTNQAMTALGAKVQIGSSSNLFLRSYRLVNPTTGAKSLNVVFSGNCIDKFAYLTAYNGVDQSTPIRASSYTTFSGSTDAAGTKSIVVSSASGDRTFSFIADNGAVSLTTNQTLQAHDESSGDAIVGADDAAGAATVTHTWDHNLASVSSIAITAGSLQASTTSTPDSPSVNDSTTLSESTKLGIPMMPNIFN